MKVFQFDRFGIEYLVPHDVPMPVPAPHEVLVQVKALSLNYLDLLVLKGQINTDRPLPHVPVSDAAGTVVAVGDAVTTLAVGDAVVAAFVPRWRQGPPTPAEVDDATRPGLGLPGYLAEFVAVPADALVRPPVNLTLLEAATLPIAGLTAWNALKYCQLLPGETVLLHGTGGVSLFALQLAKARGVRVIITSSDDAKLARATALGADHTLNYRTQSDWVAQVRALTGGQGVAAAVETVGGDNLNRSLQALRMRGRVAVMGFLRGTGALIDIPTLLERQASIIGMQVGSVADFEALNRAIEASNLHPVIDRVFPADQVQEALRYLEAGNHFGKVGLTF